MHTQPHRLNNLKTEHRCRLSKQTKRSENSQRFVTATKVHSRSQLQIKS